MKTAEQLAKGVMLELFPSELGSAIIAASDAKRLVAAETIVEAIYNYAEEVSTEMAYAVAFATHGKDRKSGIWHTEDGGYIVFLEFDGGIYSWRIQPRDVFLFSHVEPCKDDGWLAVLLSSNGQRENAQKYLRRGT